MKCAKGYEFQVLKSRAGYYIGTVGAWGPHCRVSMYYKTKQRAEDVLKNKTFSRNYAEEVSSCNNGFSCFPEAAVNKSKLSSR